MSDIKIMPD